MDRTQMPDVNASVNASLNGTSSNIVYTSQDLLISSIALCAMAILPLYFGSLRSTKTKAQVLDIITFKDACTFPLYASVALTSIYLIYKYLPTYYVSIVISLHFSIVGIAGLSEVLSPLLACLTPERMSKHKFTLNFIGSKNVDSSDKSKWETLTTKSWTIHGNEVPGIILAVIIGLTYLFTKHWIANNFIAVSLALIALEYIRLEKFLNGFALLGGLFFYDIFWVFGTPVMVSVAKAFDAPIKVVFPRDILTRGVFAKEMSLLGLGDIVIPGIFVSMLLRFDIHLNRNGKQLYFHTGYIAYIVGLLVTFVVMHVFKHAQPALLYLVPACLGAPTLVALLKGDMKAMLEYSDPTEDPEETTASQTTDSPTTSQEDEHSTSGEKKKLN